MIDETSNTDSVLSRVAALAARACGVSTAIIRCGPEIRAQHGEIGNAPEFSATRTFPLLRGVTGRLELCDPSARPPLDAAERASLDDVVAVIAALLEQDRQAVLLAEATNRAVRADRILRMVTEAPSCTGALTSLLEELCRQHHAAAGRIWRLLPDGRMVEESRFNSNRTDAETYYHMPAPAPVHAGNSRTAQAILRNQAEAFIYSAVKEPDRYVLLANAIAAGLASQVSFPFWVGEERFGVALAFNSERADLKAVVADIASLANIIRPALLRKVTEERIYHLAHHDGLTQLANRLAFSESLQGQIRRAKEHGLHFALLYLDLDGFKAVNDTYGHEAGDTLLVMVAQRIRLCVRDGEQVARLGGDEFAVILSPAAAASAPDDAACGGTNWARRLLDRFKEPFVIDGRPNAVGVTVGIACFPADGTTADGLLHSADVALYDCKRSAQRGFRVFDAKLGSQQRSRSTMRQELEAALADKQFGMAFHPVRNLAHPRAVHGLEAVIHWRHPGRGMLPLAEFLPVVDATGLAMPVGRWMLDAACRAAAAWAEPWMLSIAILPGQIRHPGLLAQVEGVLAETGLRPERLNVEVPEHLLLTEAGLLANLQGIKRLGVQITLSGFGASPAGLGWLRSIQFDRIKLHPGCVAELEVPGTLALVQAVLALRQQLGVELMATSVGTEPELLALAKLGFTLVQGLETGIPGTAVTA